MWNKDWKKYHRQLIRKELLLYIPVYFHSFHKAEKVTGAPESRLRKSHNTFCTE